MNKNGFIVQKRSLGKYSYMGVDGDNWALKEYSNELKRIYDEEIDRSWYCEKWVDVCDNLEVIKEALGVARSLKLEIRVLFCETDREEPVYHGESVKMKFLGFDYAYAGGSYYSAVLNDIVSERIELLKEYKLNEFGLFNSLDEMKQFIAKRKMIKRNTSISLEEGDFVCYKLYEVDTAAIENQ